MSPVSCLYPVHSGLTGELAWNLYEQGIFYPFNWRNWSEGERLYKDPQALEKADLLTLRKLLTLHLRQDRFCEGHLGDMFQEGHITAILRRMKVLRDAMNPPSED